MLNACGKSRARGFALIEALIAVAVLSVGLLGLAKLQVSSQRLAMESYQRAQAVILLQDMLARMNANRGAAPCYAVTTNAADGAPWLGNGFAGTIACTNGTPAQQAVAVNDLTQWDQLLKGAAESAGGTSVGAMILARGCISYDVTKNEYLVTVVWQGLVATAAPPAGLTCAKNNYNDEAQRRAISSVVRFAELI